MAEPVIVPVQLEVTDIDMSNFSGQDVQKQISSSLTGVRKSMEKAFSQIDHTKATKPLLSGMRSLENSFIKVNNAQKAFYKEVVKAGKSADSYKSLVAELNEAKTQLDTLGKIRSAWENDDGDFVGTPAMWETYLDACEKYEAQLYKVQDLQAQVNDPGKFAKDADPFSQAIVESSLRKLVSAVKTFNQESEKFNKTAEDNKISDEYQEMVKEAEAYKKKLDDLNEKSKRMEALGATDKQWEALRYDTEQVSASMDKVIKKMREAVKTGSAFRFGDGNKQDLSRQINSLSMSAGNRAGNIRGRANANQSPYTEDYQKSLDELDKLEKKVEAIKAKSAEMAALGASDTSITKLNYQAEVLAGKLSAAKEKLVELVNSGNAFKFGDGNVDNEIDNINTKINELTKYLKDAAKNAEDARNNTDRLVKVANGIKSLYAKVGKLAKQFGQLTKKIFSSVASVLGLKNAGKSLTTNLNKSFQKLNRNILMFGFGFRTAYYAIKRLRTIFINSFKVMGEQFDEVGQPMMRLMESFNRLKGSLATAFQPLVSVVIPILTRFMNYLSGVLEGIGKFMAAITGQGRIYKAVAKNINSVADAAGNANEKLGAYDKLEVISNDTNNNTGVDYEMQELEATDAASRFAQMVKDAWEKADFTSVGQFITTKLLDILNEVETSIVPKIYGFVNRLAASITTLVNGMDLNAIGQSVGSIFNALLTGLEADSIGEAFASIYNIFWEFTNGFVNEIDWDLVGLKLAQFADGFVNTLNKDAISGTIGETLRGITDAIHQFFVNFDVEKLSSGISAIINSIISKMSEVDATGLTGWQKLGESLQMLAEGIIQTLKDIDWFTLGQGLGDFLAALDWVTMLTSLAGAILGGLTSAIAGYATKDPLGAGIAAALLIAIGSANVVLAIAKLSQFIGGELGKSIVAKLLGSLKTVGGVLAIVEGVILAVSSFFSMLKDGFSWAKEAIMLVGIALATVGAILLGVAAWPAVIVAAVVAAVATIVILIKDNWEVIKQFFTDLWNGFIDFLKSAGAWIKEKWQGLTSFIKTTATNIFKALREGFEGFKNNVKSVINGILGFFEGLVNGVVKAVNKIIKAVNSLSFDVPDWVPGIGGKKFGFNLKEIKEIKIPRLAQGAVIPPNKEFLAMLGDQKSGTNIEAPLDTIKQALAEVMAEFGGGNREPIVLQVNGRALAKVVWDEQEKRYKQTGKSMA